MKLLSVSNLALLGSIASLLSATKATNVCLMLYQMADNNLEVFLRQDLLELIQSPGILDESLTTWIYFDGRDRNNVNDFYISEPLEDVWTSDGSQRLSSKYSGSQYLHFRHDLGKMVVEEQLGELDSDQPQSLYDFMVYGLSDCVASKTIDEYMLVLSSHGTGFAGYGGDDNDERRRHLVQSNANIKYAISSALSTVDGAPSKLDVLGFDACLMSSVLAMREYQSIVNYVLASEATEPGHGYAYRELTNNGSARQIAESLHNNFLTQRHGTSHQSPKTMALVDMAVFPVFSEALEALFEDLSTRLVANNDADFHSLLQRARASSVAFGSVLDDSGIEHPSAVDVGSFLSELSSLCNPPFSSTLGQSLQNAQDTYRTMFVAQGIGPGTPRATGMHIMFPMRNVYKSKREVFDSYLFENESLDLPPQWLSFMQAYLSTSSPPRSADVTSICGMSTTATGASTVTATTVDYETTPTVSDGGAKLLIDPTVVVNDTPRFSGLTLQTEITTNTDLVSMEVGIDSSALVTRRRRLLQSDDMNLVLPQSSSLLERLRPALHTESHRNLLQEDGKDYIMLYLGTVMGKYNQSKFTASWGGEFFFLGDTVEGPVPVYVYDEGNGARSVPVMYFPPNRRIHRNDIPIGTTLEQAVTMGATFGSLNFGYNTSTRELTTAFTLMTDDGIYSANVSGSTTDGDVFAANSSSTKSETLASVGGQVVPILFLDGRVDGYEYSMFLGGFDRTIFDWSDRNPLEIQLVSAANYLEAIPSVNTLVVNLRAFDFDGDGTAATGEQDKVTFRLDVSAASKSFSQALSFALFTCSVGITMSKMIF